MKDLEELRQWCEDHDAWLTFNFYKGKYKCFVNPGTKMTVAPWYATQEEAIAACWAAIGGKPKYECKNASDVKYRGYKAGDFVMLDTITGGYIKASDPEKITGVAITDTTVAVGLVDIPVKRRGRPKGSKNKPKEVV
jgi:hypothetical protein